ncbi:MAG: HlyD family efflux transporter periplasmic adaptor subunit [Planctomycetaceae bacterium]|nr:MAG: HlyD family efflux transporter periplasmic adaptor subunit [Planctomycetaceae bacterium]
MNRMRWKLPALSRRWLLLPPVLLGIGVAASLIALREPPRRQPERETSRAVRVIRIEPVEVIPRAFGYGTAEPGQVWRAVAEVRGRVVEVHPQLRAGAMIETGTVLLRIDPAEYELAVAQFEADIARLDAQREELAVREANDRDSLEIEQASLELAESELQRLESLADRNVVSTTELDQQRRTVLTQRQNVQRLQNALKLAPQQRNSLAAELAFKQAGLAQAELDVAKTVLRAPFTCRLGEVQIQPEQFLAAGQFLFEAHDTSSAEIEARIPLDQLRPLIDPRHRVSLEVTLDAENIQELFNFQVIVRYRSGDFQAQWNGRVVRMREQLDPRTRTAALVVAVDKPYEQAIPGQRPPLMQGMYCEVELRGGPRPGCIVIPRSALHEGHVFVLDSDRRLRRRQVEISFTQAGFACVEKGLGEGELLVVSDPAPAIEGMLTEPVLDEPTRQQLEVQAGGEELPR